MLPLKQFLDISQCLKITPEWISSFKYKNKEIKFVKLKACRKFANNEHDEKALTNINSKNDLIAGNYEGGFKIWECTIDMINFIDENKSLTQDSSVLEIGCGGGLVGIKCLLEDAKLVHFQDFNESVLKWFTLPNIIVNLQKDVEVTSEEVYKEINKRCKFYAGDWNQIKHNIQVNKVKYNKIFSCETIYNQENYEKLISLIKSSLEKDGIAFIAAKSYYFGLNGGIQEFKEYASTNGFTITTEKIINDNLQKEILKMTFK